MSSIIINSHLSLGVKSAAAIFQNNPNQVTLTDVLVCLTLFQNPGVNLTAEQIAAGVGGILGQVIPPQSFNPVPSRDLCNFIEGNQTGVDLADVIAVLVVFHNPGVTLTPTQLVAGINGILRTNLPPTAVRSIPGAPPPAPIELDPPLSASNNGSELQFSVPKTGGRGDDSCGQRR
ncbi:MAG: hypothetical protein Q6K99_07945 [Thermostichales cyanobacterium BF4_bins_65]